MAESVHPKIDLPVICNAVAGHDGPHAAWTGAGELVHTWPRAENDEWVGGFECRIR